MIKSECDKFLSNTDYERLVDLKKLKFIFLAIQNYAFNVSKNLDRLMILEVGCGEGRITVPLGSIGCLVQAFDINEKAVTQVKTKIKEKDFQNVSVSVDDGYTFDDGRQYDIVILSEVLEHLQDPFRLLANISKRMRTGSYFIITVPNGFGLCELRNRLFLTRLDRSNTIRRILGYPPYSNILGQKHLQFHRRPQLVLMLSQFSFDLVDFSNSDSFLAALWTSISKPIKQLERTDIGLADVLPYWCASGWFLLFRKSQD